MVERGVLDEGRRVELIEGELIDKMTKGPPHFICQTLLNHALHRVAARRAGTSAARGPWSWTPATPPSRT